MPALLALLAILTTPPIHSDVSQLRALSAFADKAQSLATEWYPKTVDLLGEDGPPHDHITILMDTANTGVAGTTGATISVSTAYVVKHPDDLGMIVHELTHVVQGYPKYDPVWLVEGIADWVRWFNYEPVDKRPHPNPDRAKARASYRTTAAFLDWARGKYDKDLVKKLNKSLRDATYSEDLWKSLTGKSLDDLETEWIASLRGQR